MCLHKFVHQKRIEMELEFNSGLTLSIFVWARFGREAEEAVHALFDSCKNPQCHYFQHRLAQIELAFGY